MMSTNFTRKIKVSQTLNFFIIFLEEQFDRISLFYILEQKHKEALEKDGPLDKAQEELVNYFKDPANTKFYEKNKIQ